MRDMFMRCYEIGSWLCSIYAGQWPKWHACEYPTRGDFEPIDSVVPVLGAQTRHVWKRFGLGLLVAWLSTLLLSTAQASLLLNLVDDETGQPVMRRNNGYEEPFEMRLEHPDRSVLLYGLSSQTLIRIKGERPPMPTGIGATGEKRLLIGYRFQLQDSGRWVRVAEWPYDTLEKYTNTTDLGSENNPANRYRKAMHRRLMSDDLLERQTWLAFNHGPEDCQMWGFSMLVMMDSENQKVRWAKTYAVARKGILPADDISTPCEKSNWHVRDSLATAVFMSPNEIALGAVDMTTDPAKPNGRAGIRFLVSPQTGDIIPGTGAPPGWKAVNVEELVRFKEAFFAMHRCPQYTRRLRQEARHDDAEFPDTPAGRCMTQRSHRYTDELRTRFLGEPLPPLPHLPAPTALPH